MSFGLNGFASWVMGKMLSNAFCTFNFFLLNWSELLNICRTRVSSSCQRWCSIEKLQTHVRPKHETKALQNVAARKKWKANSSSNSATALLAAASIELRLYRVWYTGFYPAFTGWLIQYAAKQGRISSVIEKYELKGRPSPIVRVTVQCNQLYPCHISCHIITFSANTHINENLFSCT